MLFHVELFLLACALAFSLLLSHSLFIGARTGRGDVTFDNFVQASVTVKTLTDSFRKFDTDNDGWIQISYEQVR